MARWFYRVGRHLTDRPVACLLSPSRSYALGPDDVTRQRLLLQRRGKARPGRLNRAVDRPSGGSGGPDTMLRVSLPVIDMSGSMASTATAIERACRDSGFFYVTGHGVPAGAAGPPRPRPRVLRPARGGEDGDRDGARRPGVAGILPGRRRADLRSARPQGGPLLRHRARAGHPRVRPGLPLHGPQPLPAPGAGAARGGPANTSTALTGAAQAVLRGVALSLGLDADYFATGYTADPTVLFRIFHYPPPAAEPDDELGRRRAHRLRPAHPAGPGRQRRPAGAHAARLDRRAADPRHLRLQHRRHARPADRRLLPVDAAPGPQPQRPRAAVVPVLLRPRLHRRGTAAARGRRRGSAPAGQPRWDGADLRAFTGTYGDYLLGKVAKVFPQLQSNL